MELKKLFFVYNASSDTLSKYIDFAHKIVSPKTYACDLCSITHGNFGEREVWEDFRENNPVEMVFLYKDQFLKQYASKWLPKFDFPFAFIENDNGSIDVVISAKQFETLSSQEDLIAAIAKIEAL